jgi:hypothetical protein
MPDGYVLGRRPEEYPRLEMIVIKVQIQVMALKIHVTEDA